MYIFTPNSYEMGEKEKKEFEEGFLLIAFFFENVFTSYDRLSVKDMRFVFFYLRSLLQRIDVSEFREKFKNIINKY